MTDTDICRLPAAQQRRLFDAFHLELRYNDLTGELDLRVTITEDTATELGTTVRALLENPTTRIRPDHLDEDALRDPRGAHQTSQTSADDLVAEALRARGGSRTRTPREAAAFKAAVSAVPPPGRACSHRIGCPHGGGIGRGSACAQVITKGHRVAFAFLVAFRRGGEGVLSAVWPRRRPRDRSAWRAGRRRRTAPRTVRARRP